jgi:hypothetical protein
MQRRWQINVPVRFQVPKLQEAPRRVLHSSSAFRALALAKPAVCFDCSAYSSRKLGKAQTNTPLHITGLRPDKSTCGSGRSSASPRGFESGDSNLSKLTNVFATMQLTGPDMSLRLVMLIPLAIKSCIFEARIKHYSNLFLLLNESFVYLLCLCIFTGRAKRDMSKQRKVSN